MDLNYQYRLRSPDEIIKHLHDLKDKACPITVKLDQQHNAIITRIINIDKKNEQLILRYGPKEYLNKLLIKSTEPKFQTEMDGVSIVFFGKEIKKKRMDSQVVFLMPIPSSIFWIKKRQSFRLKIPLSHDAHCQITYSDLKDNLHTKNFKLQDISVSGLAFHDEKKIFKNDIVSQQELRDCKLHLNGIDIDNITLTIVNKTPFIHNDTQKGLRVGCAFIKLIPKSESTIARYMQRIEQELRRVSQSQPTVAESLKPPRNPSKK